MDDVPVLVLYWAHRVLFVAQRGYRLAKISEQSTKKRQRRIYPTGAAHWRTNPAKPVLQRLARQLRRRGLTDTAIAAELGIERHTVVKYIGRRRSGPWSRKRRAAPATPTDCVKPEDSAGCVDKIMDEPQS